MMKVSIQGVEGCFCEQAARKFLAENAMDAFKFVYDVTSDKVLSSIEQGQVDYGVVGLFNTTGGIVDETVKALAKYQVEIHTYFPMLIQQTLLSKQAIDFQAVKSVHSHPQALSQCHEFLQTNMPQADLVTEADTAESAKRVAKGDLPKNAIAIAPILCAELYDLHVLKEKAQDDPSNTTYFLIVTPRSDV